MIEFPFWCPICNKSCNAKADPVALLFGASPDLIVTCSECDTAFRAVVTYGEDGVAIETKEATSSAAE